MCMKPKSREGNARPGSCTQTVMEHPPRPDPLHNRIVRATARVNAAMARVSQAQEVVTEAKERLAVARLILEDSTVRGARDPPRGDAAERS